MDWVKREGRGKSVRLSEVSPPVLQSLHRRAAPPVDILVAVSQSILSVFGGVAVNCYRRRRLSGHLEKLGERRKEGRKGPGRERERGAAKMSH